MSSTDRYTTITRPLHDRYVRYTPSSTRSVAILAGPLGAWARFLFFVLTRPPARSESPGPPVNENSMSLGPGVRCRIHGETGGRGNGQPLAESRPVAPA